jgi:hypothetical protein
MRRFKKLTEIVRTISPQAELTFKGIPDRDDWWICLVSVGSVIIVDTAAGPIEDVLNEAIKKIGRMSQRIRAAVAIKNGDSIPPPPSSEEPDK